MMPTQFKLTDRQKEARKLLGSGHTYIALEGGSRCVAGDTILDGHTKTISELAKIGKPVEVITSRGKQMAGAPFLKGRCKMLKVEFESGISITVTPDHKFWNGKKWIKAETCEPGHSLASLSSSVPNHHWSIRELFLSEFGEDARNLKRICEDYQDGYFDDFHQYDRQPRQALSFDPTYRASRFYELAHSLLSYFRPMPVLNSHIHYPDEHAEEYIQNDLGYDHQSRMDDYRKTYRLFVLLNRVSSQISVWFQDLHSKYRPFLQKSSLFQSFLRAVDSGRFRFCQFFCLSYDKPLNYEMDKVLIISETAEMNYYTLHVPTAEHYAANGIFHHNSGKTFLLVRAVIIRAIVAAGSRHAILRFRFNHVKASIIRDTFPKVMALCFPNITYKLDKTDWFAQFPNGSEIWFGGLDDKERTEKILGQEHSTIYLNESSQIPYSSVLLAMTRLAQVVEYELNGQKKKMQLKMYFDLNPPSQAHWTYKIFHQKRDPETNKLIRNPEEYAVMSINPVDNQENLPKAYLEMLKNMPARMRKRFYEGKYADTTENALFSIEMIEKWRDSDNLPDMLRIVIGVDPSGSGDTENADNDAIGIIVGGLGTDGNGYLLEDLTMKAGPSTWGNLVAEAYRNHGADLVVAEQNYGGAMVKFVIKAANPNIKYRAVTATRGKVVRAEPISSLVEQGKIRFAGDFTELEDELYSFTTNGYIGERSPNRADAFIWVFSALFSGMVKEEKRKKERVPRSHYSGAGSWLG